MPAEEWERVVIGFMMGTLTTALFGALTIGRTVAVLMSRVARLEDDVKLVLTEIRKGRGRQWE